jgi:hypothetical protein
MSGVTPVRMGSRPIFNTFLCAEKRQSPALSPTPSSYKIVTLTLHFHPPHPMTLSPPSPPHSQCWRIPVCEAGLVGPVKRTGIDLSMRFGERHIIFPTILRMLYGVPIAKWFGDILSLLGTHRSKEGENEKKCVEIQVPF